MLPAIALLFTIGVARLRIWTIARGSRRLTIGMLAIAVASFVDLPAFGDNWLDPRLTVLGSNPSGIAARLIAAIGWYELGAIALVNTRHGQRLREWRIGMIVAAVVMIICYLIGDEFRIAAADYALSDPASLVSEWLRVCGVLAAFALLGWSVIAVPDGGRGLRWSITFMFAYAVLGVSFAAVQAYLLIARPGVAHGSYNSIASAWAIPAHVVFALAGIPGLIAAWKNHGRPPRDGYEAGDRSS